MFFSAVFIASSFAHFGGGMVEYAASAGVPAPGLLVPLSGVLILLGGLSVLTGYRARGGAWMIVLFLVPVTLVMHKFWGLTDPQMAMQQQIHFMKNVCMLGGALLIAAFGAGPASLDERRFQNRLARRQGARTETPIPAGLGR
jgi:putative oxidoreductase